MSRALRLVLATGTAMLVMLSARAQFNATQVSAGNSSTCATTASGVLNCWGFNLQGQLGVGDRGSFSDTPQVVSGLEGGVRSFAAANGQFACAVTQAGAAKCWGHAEDGLGDGVSTNANSPVQLMRLTSGVDSIAIGYRHICALLSTGGVTCFGNNASGQLGDGNPSNAYIPTGSFAVGLSAGVKQLAAGDSHTCALTIFGGVKCWGANTLAQLGDGTSTNRTTPVDVVGLSSGVAAISSSYHHTCALMESGTVKCWGYNDHQQAGAFGVALFTPTDVPGITNASAVAAGTSHTCAAIASGGVKCWGANDTGQLGDGTFTQRAAPTSVLDITRPVNALSAGWKHTCANVADLGLSCWGEGLVGRLGAGPGRGTPSPSPNVVMAAKFAPSYQGLWWRAPAGVESGWGVNIAHQGEILFATWFTYDEQRNGLWLVMPEGRRTAAGRYTGTLYRTLGPRFDTPAWNPAQVSATAVGVASFRFTSLNSGAFEYSLGGVTYEKEIVKQVFQAAPPSCALGADAGTTPNYSDLWWRSPGGSESGWGLNITHQGNVLFATWFTYTDGGFGQWLVMSNGVRTAPGVYEGSLYRTRGPAYNAVPWNPIEVVATPVGNARLSFSGANAGTFEYTLDGVSQSKPITRQVFSALPTVCK